MKNLLKNVLELMGIVYLRFHILPRIWCVWLVGVNAACLYYIAHIEAQVVLAVTAIAVVAQALIYDHLRFTRVMGIAHILWLPMFAWMWTRVEIIRADEGLATWLMVLAVTNAISLIIDAVEVARFASGDRGETYRWALT